MRAGSRLGDIDIRILACVRLKPCPRLDSASCGWSECFEVWSETTNLSM